MTANYCPNCGHAMPGDMTPEEKAAAEEAEAERRLFVEYTRSEDSKRMSYRNWQRYKRDLANMRPGTCLLSSDYWDNG